MYCIPTAAAGFGSRWHSASTSNASANSEGKSPCVRLTSIRPPRSRDCHKGLAGPVGSRCTSSANCTPAGRALTVRFAAWLRRSFASALTPVGRWTSTTAVETLLRCCPPGPERRRKRISHCEAIRPAEGRRDGGRTRAKPFSWPFGRHAAPVLTFCRLAAKLEHRSCPASMQVTPSQTLRTTRSRNLPCDASSAWPFCVGRC